MNDGAQRLYRTTRDKLLIRGLFLEVTGRVTLRAEGNNVATLTGTSTRATVPSAIRYRKRTRHTGTGRVS